MAAWVRNAALIDAALALLIVLTLILLSWHRFGMNSEFLLDPQHIAYNANTDTTDNGNSRVTLSNATVAPFWQCQIHTQYEYPYCDLLIELTAAHKGGELKGVDLTRFDAISYDLDYSPPANTPRNLRSVLGNFEPSISKKNERASLKINEVEFELPANGQITIPLKFFHVASWWLSENKIPVFESDFRIDNVTLISISTPSVAPEGLYTIRVKSVKLTGKWISQTQLLMLIVAAWSLFGLITLITELISFRRHLTTEKARVKQLQSLNLALELETQELAGQARTDPLTGALNREGLREYFLTQWQQTVLVNAGVCIIFADIDFFKKVNDTYGHSVGDAVLQQFAQIIQREIRSDDRLARWGGEEFLIVCSQAQAEQALAIAEKLRLAVSSHLWPENIPLTCSFGVAAYLAGEDFGQMIKRADEALYRAKAEGRNRVIMAAS